MCVCIFVCDVCMCIEQIELPAKLLDYFLWSNKSNINQYVYLHLYVYECIHDCIHSHTRTAFLGAGVYTHAHTHERACRALLNEGCSNASVEQSRCRVCSHMHTHMDIHIHTHTYVRADHYSQRRGCRWHELTWFSLTLSNNPAICRRHL